VEEFYTSYYAAIEHSQAHHTFCERVFGRDFGQHGFANLEQLELILHITGLAANHRVLDLGCGNGMIAEYLSDRTGAHITGLDYIPQAIHHAQRRTASKAQRLAFRVGDINQLDLPANAFDLMLSIDSIYFSNDYIATLRNFQTALRPSGQMVFLYSYGCEPWVPKETFPAAMLVPDQTPLAQALQASHLPFQTWDLTDQDYRLAQRRKTVLMELQPYFEAEGLQSIYENRLGDAEGISQAIEEGLHVRYLYHSQLRN